MKMREIGVLSAKVKNFSLTIVFGACDHLLIEIRTRGCANENDRRGLKCLI